MTASTTDSFHPLFPMGLLVATHGAADSLDPKEVACALRDHLMGHWGNECCEEDWEANDEALKHGGRLLSFCRSKDCVKFYIVTEADRSVTTVLLPSEY